MLAAMRYFKILNILVLGFVLAACGGGGGDNGGPATTINVSDTSLDFILRTGTFGSQNVTVNYSGDVIVVGTPPNDPDFPSWLSVDIVGSEYDNPLTVSVTVTPGVTGYPGVPGTYTATLRFVTGRSDGTGISYVDVPVTFDLYSPVTVDTTPRTVSLYKDASTGNNAGALQINAPNAMWTAQASQPWLQLNQASGNTSSSISYSIDVSQLGISESNAVITVHDEYENVDHVVPVTAYIQPNKLQVSRQNLAFSYTPGRSQVNLTTDISDLAGSNVQWQVTTTSNWLNLNQSNTVTPASLTVSADQTSLSPGMHYATIDVSSMHGSVTSNETIYVGFYVSDTDPAAASSSALAGPAVNTVHDALAPYVYVSYGNNTIDIYNTYTASLVDTITFPVGTEQLGSMAVSDDGESLFIYNEADQTIIKYGLKTSAVVDTFAGAGAFLKDLHFTRVQGYPLLLLSNGSILDPGTGASYATFTGQEYISIQNNHDRFIATHYGFNWGHTLNQINLYAIPDVSVSVVEIDAGTINDTRRRCDDAVNPTGNKFYIVCDTDNFINSYIVEYSDFSTSSQSIIQLGETSSNPADNIELLTDTLALVGTNTRIAPRTNAVSLFDLTTKLQTPLTLDTNVQTLSLLWREMRVAPDGRRLSAIHYQGSPAVNRISFTDLP